MSWSHYYESKRAFAVGQPDTQSGTADPDQLRVARELVQLMITSGAVGPAEFEYFISISAHANPLHLSAEGYARDFLQINVRQLSGGVEQPDNSASHYVQPVPTGVQHPEAAVVNTGAVPEDVVHVHPGQTIVVDQPGVETPNDTNPSVPADAAPLTDPEG